MLKNSLTMNNPSTTQGNRRSPRLWALALVAGSALWLSGCSSHDRSLCASKVQAAFPNGQVAAIPSEAFKFIVREPDGSVWLVETMNQTNAEVSSKVRLFLPNNEVRGG